MGRYADAAVAGTTALIVSAVSVPRKQQAEAFAPQRLDAFEAKCEIVVNDVERKRPRFRQFYARLPPGDYRDIWLCDGNKQKKDPMSRCEKATNYSIGEDGHTYVRCGFQELQIEPNFVTKYERVRGVL